MNVKQVLQVVAAVIVVSCTAAYGQVAGFEHRISVSATGDDELGSQLRRAFRAIPDVVVTDQAPREIVRIVVIAAETAGRPTGLVASILVTDSPTDVKQFWKSLDALAECRWKGGPESSWPIGMAVADRVSVKAFSVFTGSLNREEMARRIAAYVDEQTIEPARQAYQELAAKGLLPK